MKYTPGSVQGNRSPHSKSNADYLERNGLVVRSVQKPKAKNEKCCFTRVVHHTFIGQTNFLEMLQVSWQPHRNRIKLLRLV